MFNYFYLSEIKKKNIIFLKISHRLTMNDFIYLGSSIINEDDCETGLKRNICHVKDTMDKMQKIWNVIGITNHQDKNTFIYDFPHINCGAGENFLDSIDSRRPNRSELVTIGLQNRLSTYILQTSSMLLVKLRNQT